MRTYLLRRFPSFLLTLFLISLVTFVVVQVVPGDPAQLILGTEAPPEALAELRAQLGLDRPLPLQYLSWLSGVLRGNLGVSLRHGRPVAALIAGRLPVTLSLAFLSLILAVFLALPLGILAAVRQRSALDYGVLVFAQAGLALPSFWIGILLILLFALSWRWLPSGGYVPWGQSLLGALRTLAMPVLALGLPMAGVLARLVRASMLEELTRDHIRTARAKGLSEAQVILRHALKNALIPTVTVLGLQLGFLLGGSIVVEQVFALPGLGRLVLFAINNRDLPLIQGLVLFIAALVVVINFLVDLAYAWLDPRISLENK
ncbi:MAG: ABC transporter permease [Anaerolineae bacterium]|nr:ABC transporter permease [Anaerolineae bacterium]